MKTGTFFAFGVWAALAAAHAQDAQEVANKAAQAAYYRGDDGRAKVTMNIVDKQGRERSREFTILRRDAGDDLGEQQFYVFFRLRSTVYDP